MGEWWLCTRMSSRLFMLDRIDEVGIGNKQITLVMERFSVYQCSHEVLCVSVALISLPHLSGV